MKIKVIDEFGFDITNRVEVVIIDNKTHVINEFGIDITSIVDIVNC